METEERLALRSVVSETNFSAEKGTGACANPKDGWETTKEDADGSGSAVIKGGRDVEDSIAG